MGAIDGYRVIQPLGSGGFGEVALAEQIRTGRRVALKTVRDTSADVLASTRREIEALASIQHPGVARILDHGVSDVPWYAMELVEGPTLGEHWAMLDGGSPTVDLSRPAATAPSSRGAPRQLRHLDLTLLRRLADTLAYIHGRGLVHRDLKPSNVLVSKGGWPILVDFGLAARFAGKGSRERLERSGDVVGTADYMAPEQARAELVDARADIYALGCIVYRLLAGSPPFTGRSASEILVAHLTSTPPALPEGTDGLGQLVMRMLAKEPRDRVGYAEDVAGFLDGLGAEPWPLELPPPRTYLYRPALAGRRAQLRTLRRALPGPKGEAVTLLLGEAGCGKTRLLAELSTVATASGVTVLLGECHPPPASNAPLAGLARPLRALLDHLGETRRRELSNHVDVVAPYLPGTTAAVPPELPPEAARERLIGSVTELLGAAAGGRTMLVLDDVQWADELTLLVVSALVKRRRLAPGRFTLALAARSDARAALTQLGAFDEPDARAVVLELSRLDAAAVRALIADMLAMEEVPEPLACFLEHESEGNPLFVAEYLQGAVDAGMLLRTAGRWRFVHEDVGRWHLPGSLRDLLRTRLDLLPMGARRLLEVVAVLGRDVDDRRVEAAAARVGAGSGSDAALVELVARNMLAIQGSRWRITHDKIREVAYGLLEPTERAALHRAAARAIESEDPVGDSWAELARHREAAGEAHAAATAYLEAGRFEASRYAFADAGPLLQAALRGAGSDSRLRIDILLALASTLRARNLHAEAVALLEGEEALASSWPDAHRELASCLGSCYLRLGDLERSEAWLLRAVELAHDADVRVRADHKAALAAVYQVRCDWKRAMALALEAQELTGGSGQEARHLERLGHVLLESGDHARARAALEQGLEKARSLGDRRLTMLCLWRLAVIGYRTDDPTAESTYRAAIAEAAGIGDRLLEATASSDLANLLDESGRHEEATSLYERAIVAYRDMNTPLELATALMNLSDNSLRQGDIAHAFAGYDEALSIADGLKVPRLQGMVRLELADLGRLVQKPADEMRALLDTAMPHLAGDPVYLAMWHAYSARQRMSAGGSGRADLERASTMSAGLGSGDGPLGRLIAAVDSEVAAFEAGVTLWRGCLPENLPAALRAALT